MIWWMKKNVVFEKWILMFDQELKEKNFNFPVNKSKANGFVENETCSCVWVVGGSE